jgi:hypothetical protein
MTPGVLALAHKRAKRQRVSGMIPYGFKLDEDGLTLTDAPEEQAAVAMVQEMRARGYSTRRIGSELLRQGIRPRCGTHWHPKVIMDLCRRDSTAAASPTAY